MNDKWYKLKKFISYRLTYDEKDSSDYTRGMIKAYEDFENMMNLLEDQEPMQENDWNKCSVGQAIQYWSEGHDVRCEIKEDVLIYTKPKGDYDTMEDQ